jgi:hemin uptake protein HemP
MASTEDRGDERAQEDARPTAPRIVRAEDLFDGDQEIWIDHAGDRYRLRITRRNKLILQK